MPFRETNLVPSGERTALQVAKPACAGWTRASGCVWRIRRCSAWRATNIRTPNTAWPARFRTMLPPLTAAIRKPSSQLVGSAPAMTA
jgi:hypothetical protein